MRRRRRRPRSGFLSESDERIFYFALAERLGMTVGELLDRMTSAELTEWAAYFPAQRFYQQMAEAAE